MAKDPTSSSKIVKKNFEDVGRISRDAARAKKERSSEIKPIIFSTLFNPHGPDIGKIIGRHKH